MKAEYAEECVSQNRKSVADQFASVKYRSETYCSTQKLNREDYVVDVLVFLSAG